MLSRLHEEAAADKALLRDGTVSVTVPSARARGLVAGLFAVLQPPAARSTVLCRG